MSMNGTYIGVDFGGTNIRAARVTNGVMVENHNAPTPLNPKGREDTLNALINVIASVMNEDVQGIGIGVPSVVDREKGIVYNVANIPYWDEVPLKEIIGQRFSLPVFINNDANCFAIAERYFGEGKDVQNFVGITLGTGLGGGIIQKGQLLADANCGSGEFGHVPYLEHDIEYYCSGSFFMHVYGISGKEMYQRALQQDKIALGAYERLGRHLSEAIKIIILTVDPAMIVFGGSVAVAHPLFEKSMRAGLADFRFPRSVEKLKICYSQLKHAGVLGAVSLCY